MAPWRMNLRTPPGWLLPRAMAASTASVTASTMAFMDGSGGVDIFYLFGESPVELRRTPFSLALRQRLLAERACVITCLAKVKVMDVMIDCISEQ